MQKRARAILRIEDAWLGEILQLLEESHQLDHTLIVITGDHGIRSSEEDPTFRGGMVDEYSAVYGSSGDRLEQECMCGDDGPSGRGVCVH